MIEITVINKAQKSVMRVNPDHIVTMMKVKGNEKQRKPETVNISLTTGEKHRCVHTEEEFLALLYPPVKIDPKLTDSVESGMKDDPNQMVMDIPKKPKPSLTHDAKPIVNPNKNK